MLSIHQLVSNDHRSITTPQTSRDATTTFRFLDLPSEIQTMVCNALVTSVASAYPYVLPSHSTSVIVTHDRLSLIHLSRTCHALHHIAQPIFWAQARLDITCLTSIEYLAKLVNRKDECQLYVFRKIKNLRMLQSGKLDYKALLSLVSQGLMTQLRLITIATVIVRFPRMPETVPLINELFGTSKPVRKLDPALSIKQIACAKRIIEMSMINFLGDHECVPCKASSKSNCTHLHIPLRNVEVAEQISNYWNFAELRGCDVVIQAQIPMQRTITAPFEDRTCRKMVVVRYGCFVRNFCLQANNIQCCDYNLMNKTLNNAKAAMGDVCYLT